MSTLAVGTSPGPMRCVPGGLALARLLAAAALLAPTLVCAFDTPAEAQSWYERKIAQTGAVSWDTLSALEIEAESIAPLRTIMHVRFSEAIRDLDEQEVKIIGFIYPTTAGRTHSRFLLSALPPGCPFCLPGGVTELVDVECAEEVVYTTDPIVLEGRFHVLEDDPSGMYYRLTQARAIE